MNKPGFTIQDALDEINSTQGLFSSGDLAKHFLWEASVQILALLTNEINALEYSLGLKDAEVALISRNNMSTNGDKITDAAVRTRVDNHVDIMKMKKQLLTLREKKTVHQALNAIFENQNKWALAELRSNAQS